MGNQHAARGIALLRIVIGFWFLKSGLSHLAFTPLPWVSDRWSIIMPKIVTRNAEGNPIGFMKKFLEEVVLPNSDLFAGMSGLAELGVGLSLLFGIASVLGAAGGLFLSITYGLMTIHLQSSQGFHLVLVTAMIVFLVTRPGRVWGVDSILFRLKPSVPIW